jgi:antitoxin FitA
MLFWAAGNAAMGTLTIRKLNDAAKQMLRERAAARGVSMEEEARERLRQALRAAPRKKSIIDELRKLPIKPDKPIDFKKLSDEMWDESLD